MLAERRAEADREFAETDAARRAEATRRLDEAKEQAALLVAQAHETAQRVTVDSEQEVAMLQTLRRRIVQQLNSIRSDVARTAAELTPLPEEDERPVDPSAEPASTSPAAQPRPAQQVGSTPS